MWGLLNKQNTKSHVACYSQPINGICRTAVFIQYHIWGVLLCCISAGYNCKKLTDWVSTLPAVTVCVSQHVAHTLTCRVPPQVAAPGWRCGSGDVAVQSSRQDPLQLGSEGTNTCVNSSECLATNQEQIVKLSCLWSGRRKQQGETQSRWRSRRRVRRVGWNSVERPWSNYGYYCNIKAVPPVLHL